MYIGMNYINGEFCPHSPDFSSLNPATESEIGLFPISDVNAVDQAVDAAAAAFCTWRQVSRVKRAEYFDTLAQLVKKNHERLVNAISEETGKTKNESSAEVVEALHMCQVVAGMGRQPYGGWYASEIASKDTYTMRKPKGVVAVISPWNFPLAIGSFWCSAPAIMEGNCVVHKPSEYTPMVAQIACELYHEAGFPPGVFNLIHGMEHTGQALVQNDVQTILFTGSAAVGREIQLHCASSWKKNCSCEMGSKSAVLVFEDADLDIALEAAVSSAFKLSGQRCVSASRILVQRSILDLFVPAFVDRVATLKTGNVFEEEGVFYGPLINADAVHKVLSYNSMTHEEGNKIYLDGLQVNRPGYFMTPHVYVSEWDFGNSKRYLKEEVFGPHVAIIPFDTVADAIDYYNDTDYGLAVGICTNDYRIMRKCRDECRAGMFYMNGGSIGAESHVPFKGLKASGYGHASAAGTYKAVTEEIVVTINHDHGIEWAQGMK